MDFPLHRMLGVEFPRPAFSHCRDLVASVGRSGGFGVFGAAACTQPETEPTWIEARVDGKLYGVDLLIPEDLSNRTGADAALIRNRRLRWRNA
jgi:hypothetical protein